MNSAKQNKRGARKPGARPRAKPVVIKVQRAPGPNRRQRRRRRNTLKRQNLAGGGATGMGATRTGQRSRRVHIVPGDEFIAEVTVANQPNFNNVAYPVNPGQVGTFPWLSKTAKQWEKYTFLSLEFYYKREVSEFATAGSAGKVIMSFDYDAADNPPTTKQQMEDSDPHVDGMPCENNLLRISPREMHGPVLVPKYVRPGGLPGSADIRLYDVGNINVATQGIPANSMVGELRVRYVCKFEVPILESEVSAPTNNQVALFRGSNGQTSTVATVQPLATASFNGLGAVNTAGSIVLPAGNYLMEAGTTLSDAIGLSAGTLDVFKNGVTYDGVLYRSEMPGTGDTFLSLPPKITFIQSNGTDAFTVVVNATGNSGPVSSSYVRITAI